jgi:nitronate monooxygenase
VSFHFGMPEANLVQRVKSTGAKILSSANSVEEACWLEDQGCDAIIAQGFEAGGHQAMFLSDNISSQVGTIALVPQIVDAVKVPVVAAGGIADTGRPARGIVNRVMREVRPMSDAAPDFPLAATALAPLRSKAEAAGSGEFTPLWAGQAFPLAREVSAGELTRTLAEEALSRM